MNRRGGRGRCLSFSRCSEAAVVGAALVSVACEASSTRQTHGVLVAEALLQAKSMWAAHLDRLQMNQHTRAVARSRRGLSGCVALLLRWDGCSGGADIYAVMLALCLSDNRQHTVVDKIGTLGAFADRLKSR